MESHQLLVLRDHCSSAFGDIKYLICHVTSANRVIEGSYNSLSGSSSWYVTSLPSLVTIGGSRDIIFLVCHVIFQGHLIKGSYEFIIRNPSR